MVYGLLALMLTGTAPDWTATADKLAQSVVAVRSAGGYCTGMVVNAHWKNEKDLVLTDDHCYGAELYADGAIGRAVFRDSKQDFMLIEVDDLDRPAVTLAAKDPLMGQEIVSFGYGLALEKPMFRHAYVSNPSISGIDYADGGPFVMIDAAYVPGQSGGPCINDKGEVVSIVQAANGVLGVGAGVERIRDKIKRYLEKPKP